MPCKCYLYNVFIFENLDDIILARSQQVGSRGYLTVFESFTGSCASRLLVSCRMGDIRISSIGSRCVCRRSMRSEKFGGEERLALFTRRSSAARI
jgi:hypothetical protein